jgi:hypothetical protein
MMKLSIPKLFLSVVPVRDSLISVALRPAQVQKILRRNLVPELVMGSGWSTHRYTAEFENNLLFIKGPFGNKRWCLWTTVEIIFEGGGTVLKIHQRLATGNIILLVFILGFYISFALFGLEFWPFWPILLLQATFLYGVVLFNFHYEASQINKIIEKILQESDS